MTSICAFSAHQIAGMDHQLPTTKESGTRMPSSERGPPRDSESNFGASSCSDHANTTQSTSQKSPAKSPVTPAAALPIQHESDTNSPLRKRCAAPSGAPVLPEASIWNVNMDDPFSDSAESDYCPNLSDDDNDGKIQETSGGASAASQNLADGIATRTRAQFPIDTVCPVS